MTAEIKYWVWIAVWSCSCLLAISRMQGGNSDDSVSYWETKLHGARMPTFLRALVSPLTSREATQFLVDISVSGGQYLPSNAASFCNAAHIQCAQVGKEPAEQTQKSLPFHFHDGNEPKEHTQSQKIRPLKDPIFYFNYPFKNNEEVHNQKVRSLKDPIFYFNYPFMNNEDELKEDSMNNKEAHNQKIRVKDPVFYFNYPFMNNEEELKEDSQKSRPLKDPVFYFNYPFMNNKEELKEDSQKSRPLKDPIFYFNYPFMNNEEEHSQNQKPPPFKDPIFYFNYPFTNNEEEHSQKSRRSLYREVGKESKASSLSKPTLKAYNKKEDKKALDYFTADNVHEISSYYFREKQVLVSGADIQYVNFTSFTGDGAEEDDKVDRAFLPRKLAKLFPLRGDGAKIASMLGVPKKDLQETLGLCAKARVHGMNVEVGMCLPSIEDVADFIGSVLGASLNGIDMYDAASNANRGNAGSTFHVLNVKKLKADLDEPHVSCHDMAFPFRVFFCHYPKRTNLFQVTLQGEDESTHERIAVCHYDTSSWNPLHVSFAELHTKPGESEACHWLGSTWSGHSGWVFVRKAAVI